MGKHKAGELSRLGAEQREGRQKSSPEVWFCFGALLAAGYQAGCINSINWPRWILLRGEMGLEVLHQASESPSVTALCPGLRRIAFHALHF